MAGAKKPGEEKDETGKGRNPCDLGSELSGQNEFKEKDTCKAKEEANKEAKTQEEEGEEHYSQNTKEIESSKKD